MLDIILKQLDTGTKGAVEKFAGACNLQANKLDHTLPDADPNAELRAGFWRDLAQILRECAK